ncbi:calcium-translocating P-type ATPase, SERCA-type [Bacillus cereus]|uniref:calcium-translocating P-type ATPase, SERCA-type n=1 Tax=Bacillus TaxID=1386 RepID=UPI00047DC590|nr:MULTISPECIES: calcium-translocating P-type ATPase, SERCA-type [Bacillus]PFE05931.1 calcium-translocating P-type ATPase, SERCA-type [Bacillus sp. AFS023182]PGY04200.1 calcium-translocating P-type ATPase, SERCA-type [Bacillus cereus]WIY59932.1 calcium-translocating P-type ATPase, SERCA-type [Bacillus arachidis]SDY41419.1 Ca2+-transporting ATPase [Bacillus sp. 166amftsu]
MNWYEMRAHEVEERTNTNVKVGLSEQEAEGRLKKLGPNELQEAKRPSALVVFLSQFKDFMVLVLFGATIISAFLGEYIDAIAIVAIVIINGILGFFQERKAEKSLEALKELAAPQVTVLRNGKWIKAPSKALVLGDVIKFSSGDRIGADIRLIEASSLYIEESALTGESVPVQKKVEALQGENVAIGDQRNMAFMGTMITRGSGIGVVVGTGMNTAMGQIANMLQNAEQMETPLQRRLEQLGKILIVVALILTTLVVLAGVYQGNEVYHMFLAGVSLAVAAIPEGLPAIVTVALSLGVQRMIKKRAIVRKLPAVETLGCASVICSDKTGTMTQNKMMVTHMWSGGETWYVTGQGYEPTGSFMKDEQKINPTSTRSLYQLLTFGCLCNNASIVKKKKTYVLDGDPTEGALVAAAMKAGVSREALKEKFEIIHEFPFDSTRKMMSVIVRDRDGKKFVVTKGAPDVLLQMSQTILWGNKQQPLSELYRKEVQAAIHSLGSQALRTIAVAFKPLKVTDSIEHEREVEKDFMLVGIQGMIDPPRPEVKQAVKECKEAGIKTVMITGDHKVTAMAIAEQLGILPPNGRVIEGVELANMSVDELENIVEDTYVFARVSPEHKLKIVKALQNKDHIVAMTGDGVNDAPAIKTADIGIAMGITGTDVAKEASSLVLLDDNFATIKSAIKEGRNIYENIRKFIRYLLASNVGEILVMLFAMMLALPLPMVPIQILWVNLVTDGLPAMALGLDKAEGDVMRRNPRHPKEGVFARGLAWKIVSRGFLIGIVTLLAFIIAFNQHPNELKYAQTVAFATLVLAQLIHVFDCRSEHSIFHRNPFGNVYLVGAVIISVLLMLVVIYYPPLQPIFSTMPVQARDWLLIVGLSSIPTFLLVGSLLTGKKEKKKRVLYKKGLNLK